jgi:hypothetical protein
LLNAGYPLAEIKPLRVSAAASSAQGGSGSSSSAVGSSIASTSNMGNGIPSSYNDPSDPLGKLTSGFKLSVDELRTAGYSIEQCLQAGFDATALRAGGFNELQLVQSGLFTMKQLKKAGCDVQRFALKALFETTNGKHWRRRDGWCSNRPLSEWFGVKLDGAGNVVRIDLRSNELSGKCAVFLFLLCSLSCVVWCCLVLFGVVLCRSQTIFRWEGEGEKNFVWEKFTLGKKMYFLLTRGFHGSDSRCCCRIVFACLFLLSQ